MRVGVTGASGFLGRSVMERLCDQGHQVIGWTRDHHRAPQLLAINRDPAKRTWLPGELGSAEDADRLARSCDAMVHAACFSPGASFVGGEGDPVTYFHKNIIGTTELLEASIRHGIRRFVFVSSGAVHQRVAEDLPLDERHPLWPQSIYGAAKASVETIISGYGLSGRLSCCTIRPTSIYGRNHPPEQSRWFSLIQQVTKGETVTADGGGKVVHVDDVATGIQKLLDTNVKVDGETFNACERMISHHEVATIAKEISGTDAEIIGSAKSSFASICTEKIEKLGIRFGENDLLRQTITQIIRSISDG